MPNFQTVCMLLTQYIPGSGDSSKTLGFLPTVKWRTEKEKGGLPTSLKYIMVTTSGYVVLSISVKAAAKWRGLWGHSHLFLHALLFSLLSFFVPRAPIGLSLLAKPRRHLKSRHRCVHPRMPSSQVSATLHTPTSWPNAPSTALRETPPWPSWSAPLQAAFLLRASCHSKCPSQQWPWSLHHIKSLCFRSVTL